MSGIRSHDVDGKEGAFPARSRVETCDMGHRGELDVEAAPGALAGECGTHNVAEISVCADL